MRLVAPAVQLAVMLMASPAMSGVDLIPLCASSAHVSWLPDDRVEKIDQVVVAVTGCDQGEPVTLQVLTADSNVPGVVLVATATSGRAVFDLREVGLDIEQVIGARVTLYREEIAVLDQD